MSDGEPALESSIEDLIALEEELSGDAAAAVGTYSEGTLAGAEKVPAGEVPDDYPVAVPTSHALQLVVETDDGAAVETFLAWPEQGSDVGHVERLLEALGRDPGEFADLYGDRVALATASGWHVLDLRRTAAIHGAAQVRSDRSLRRSEQYVAGAVGLGIVGTVLWGGGARSTGGLLLFLAWLAIPSLVYHDLKRVSQKIPWETDPAPWMVGCLIPLFNAPVGTAYLIERHVRVGGVAPGETPGLWFGSVVVASVWQFLGIALSGASASLFLVLYVYGGTLVPLSIYFDAKYVGDATDWDPNGEHWGVGAAVASLFVLGWGVAAVYLLKRNSASGDEDPTGDATDDGPSGWAGESMADRDWDLLDDGADGSGADGRDSGDGENRDGWSDHEGWGEDDGWGSDEDAGGLGGDDAGDSGGDGGSDGGGGDGGGGGGDGGE